MTQNVLKYHTSAKCHQLMHGTDAKSIREGECGCNEEKRFKS